MLLYELKLSLLAGYHATAMYVCTICNLFSRRCFSAVLRHIGNTHRFDPNLNIRCGIESCAEVYKNYKSFRSHVYRKHRKVLFTTESGDDTPGCDGDPSGSDDPPECTRTESLPEVDLPTPLTPQEPLQHMAAKFLLKVREEYKLPLTTVEKLVGDFKGSY